MLTKIGPIPPEHDAQRTADMSLGYDFALLGLKASESRVDIIRQAASDTAARIQQVTRSDEDESKLMLSNLASSTYRLLDPRRRQKSGERIQLSIVSDADFEQQKGSRIPLVSFSSTAPSPPPVMVPAELVGMTAEPDSRRNKARIGTVTLTLLLLVSIIATVCMLST